MDKINQWTQLTQKLGETVDFCSLRYMETQSDFLCCRRHVVMPTASGKDAGVMVTVHHQGGLGYGATSDLSESGIKRAFAQARQFAEFSAANSLIDFSALEMSRHQGTYQSFVAKPWNQTQLPEKLELLQQLNQRLASHNKIVSFEASLWNKEITSWYLNSLGAQIHQQFAFVIPYWEATAHHQSESITRSFKGRGLCVQGGLEIIDTKGWSQAAEQTAAEAVQLLSAPNCPEETTTVLLAPDQMILQIHESIGHPIELDRILGDERNYAGTSFVTLDMFGSYQYGSSLLNISFDPTVANQSASYHYDDEGQPASKVYLIENGILKRPLGGQVSSSRTRFDPVACGRACSWNRPPIDRMANINLEPGTSSFEDLVSGIESGIYMETNSSWSIDDSRNKFQFGCELGRKIKNGKLGEVVKKPNYRGVSASFWRNLSKVGKDTEALGSPYCGKGEPNQAIMVGHRSPPCVFTHVEVFGGI